MPSEVRLENFWIWTIKKQNIKEIISQVKQGQKKMEQLNRAQKRSILGPQNLEGGSPPHPNLRLLMICKNEKDLMNIWQITVFTDINVLNKYLRASSELTCNLGNIKGRNGQIGL